jgi:hypothetical protein
MLQCAHITLIGAGVYSNVAACLPASMPKTMAGPMVEPGPG